ncbi:FxsA family protein [Nocardioides guangzhouensis]|uniref:FxsA family protein n=1 Tax=Nocardioides guangzhouensis TaxID=2497878 RepID=A0A4Q4ZG46_9ACTN|nr:FxsA family protein [Nocardioides guangzhouensis]RYP87103.1 FxsA family protein [Nocardioides guangzhouensis]
MTRVRRVPGWLLALLFFGIPLLEIIVLIQVGQAIGPWWTILLLVADSIFGAWLMRREGSRAFQALSDALRNGRMPARELADGMLILAGGLLMLAPGFITDVFGILLILPFTRPIGRRVLTRVVSARLLAGGDWPGASYGAGFWTGPGEPPRHGPGHGPGNGPGKGKGPRSGPPGPVIEGEVVDGPDDGPRNQD